jgi:radical SAM-linked protein
MFRDKVRIRFRKAGDLRLVSHHDLMRCFERMLRRAALPFHATEGFNPRPRLVFALSLPLGIVGASEIVDLELDDAVSPEEVHQRLARQAPPGLEILSVRPLDRKARTCVVGASYRVPLDAARAGETAERASALMSSKECWIERTRPEYRRLNIRPYLRALHVSTGAVEMDLWVTPNGTSRPDEVLALLGLGELLQAGAVVERIRLELQDEDLPSESAGLPRSNGSESDVLPPGCEPNPTAGESKGTP